MPLVTCPDCGKEHSDAAPACPNCGRPHAQTSVPTASPAAPSDPKKATASQAGCLLLILVGVLLWYMSESSTPRRRTAPARASSPESASSTTPSGPSLELVAWNWSTEHGFAKADGQVRNISPKPLENVAAVVTFYDKSDTFITSDDALIDYNPILPGQTSPFSVMARHNPAMRKASVEFKHMFGGTILTRKR